MDLDGPQKKILRLALLAAFNRQSLDRLLRDNNRQSLDELVKPAGLRDQVDELIEVAEEEGWLSGLISDAEGASANARIKNIRADLALVQNLPSVRGGTLERTVNKAAGFANFEDWLEKITERRGWICRIEDPRDPRKALGTGFLVGPDLVLTNYHVVRDYLPGPGGGSPKVDTSQLACRFDFSTEQPQLDGTVVPVVTESPFLSFAPFSRFDPGDRGGVPAPEEADYALLRISRKIGDEGKRKWNLLSNMVPRPAPPDTLIILQHPEGSPLKLAIGTVLELNENETRLRYSTNTEGGSSGSPCFNFNLQLVALHHGGDPDRSRAAEFNQGVPVEWIVDHIRKNPKLDNAVKTTLFTQPPANPPTALEQNRPLTSPPTTPPPSSPRNISSERQFEDAIRSSPKSIRKVVNSAYAVLAISALLLSWKLAPEVLWPTAIAVFLLGFIVHLAAKGATGPASSSQARTVSWFVIAIAVVVTSLFISAAFFRWPLGGTELLARILNQPSWMGPDETTTVTLRSAADIPPIAFATPEGRGEFDRSVYLSKLPALKLYPHAKIEIDRRDLLSASTLDLNNGTITTNGTFSIETLNLTGKGGAIRARASDGKVPFGNSEAAGDITLVVHSKLGGEFMVDASGRAGADGVQGTPGVNGAPGAEGEHSRSGILCESGPGRGQDGGRGGDGGPGGPGADGEDGGTIRILVVGDPKLVSAPGWLLVSGGKPGAGGPGGVPGQGGAGGNGGASGGACTGRGAHGSQGPSGNPGTHGADGKSGSDGEVTMEQLGQ
ncbi:trypsin-like peptidase domain-containing protein [Mesorhizobium sp. LSHC422A00]|uniref:trypsin-like peptidase domain-containing protein n=1 Tax=Mesorhizobium sp. LSHC422A00 TaxID=1287294 RepID=UPI0004066A0E|nr:trypsin-like peptidase domain-containing protein [Mesorhizobium sp. LSHC422A00]